MFFVLLIIFASIAVADLIALAVVYCLEWRKLSGQEGSVPSGESKPSAGEGKSSSKSGGNTSKDNDFYIAKHKNKKNSNKIVLFSAKYVSYLGVLGALVIILQVFSGFMKIGTTSFCLVLIPIVLGGLILGVTAGAILGVVFGFIVVVDAFLGLDPFTLYLIGQTPIFTLLLCFAKGIAAGVIPALAYKFISKKSVHLGVIVAALLAPVCNTGIFAAGCTLIMKYIIAYLTDATASDFSGMSSAYLIFIVLIGVNFFVELALNLVLSPALYTVNNVVTKKIIKGKAGK